jgi:Divergent InlB B-repeat domain
MPGEDFNLTVTNRHPSTRTLFLPIISNSSFISGGESMSKTFRGILVCLAHCILLGTVVTGAFAQTPYFSPGNIVVAVSGCGVYGGTCATAPVGGTGSGGTYGDDQASPWTLFQYIPNGASSATFVNSLQLPQTASGANSPVSDDFGSQSEGTVQLSGNGEYLTMMGYGINAADFNVNYLLYCPGSTNASNACVPENGNPATAQTGNLTNPVSGVTGTTAVPRVAALIDANGNVNTSTVLYNIFDENDARSAYSPDGVNIYVSGQGCKTCGPTPNQIPLTSANPPFDNTMGVYYTAIGATNTAPTPITGNDNGPTGCSTPSTCTASEDTRMVQIYNNTLYVSTDAKPGSSTGGYNRSLIGTLGDPASTSLFTCTGVGGGCGTGYGPYGPALMTGFGNTGGTGKVTITAGANGNGLNVINVTCSVNATTTLTCPSGTFSSVDVGDTIVGTDIPSGTTISTYTNSTSVVMSNAATGTLASDSISIGLLINISPQNFFFASPTVLYVADTGSPKNSSNNDTVCTTDGGGSKSVGNGGLQKWIHISTTFTGAVTGSKTVTATTATFSYLDVGLPISGTGIPAGTTIASVTSPTVAKLSASSTTGSNESITIGPAWSLAYTLYQGLNLVLNVDCDPANDNTTGTGSTGLYGLTGVVNNGVATLYATNYPNDDLLQTYLYGITDTLATTTNPGTSFTVLDTAPTGSLFRGVSFVPTIPNGSVEITSSPAGLAVTTAGTGCDPSTFNAPLTVPWTSGSNCTLSVTTPQTINGVQYAFAEWDNGSTSTSRSVTAPSTTATYTATFTTQYQLATTAGTGGSISAGGYYTPGSNATVTATPSNGYCFVNFTGTVLEGYPPTTTLPSTSSPLTLPMNSPQSVTANFAQGSGLYSPASGSTLAGASATFSWCAVANATAYWLDVGSSSGGNNYYQSGSLPSSTSSQTVNSLPTNGTMIYVTLWYYVNGAWSYTEYQYSAYGAGGEIATMSSPTPNSVLSGGSQLFSWNAGTQSTAYEIDAGSTSGGNQYFQSGNLGTNTSETLTSLPTNGSTVYVTLWSLLNGNWVYNAYQYTASGATQSGGAIATLTYPTPNGTTLTGSSVTFTWQAGTDTATAYWIDVGNSAGGNSYYQSGSLPTSTTFETVSTLPTDGSQVFVTLYTQVNGTWYNNPYNFFAANGNGACLATLSSPMPNSVLPSTGAGAGGTGGPTQPFTWTPSTVAGCSSAVTGYWLDAGETTQENAYYQSGQLSASTTTNTATNLPTAAANPTLPTTVQITLWTLVNGTWQNNVYDYTEAAQ